MNTKAKKLILVMLCVVLLTAVCVAAGSTMLSPALEEIEKQITLKKCGVVNSDIVFNTSDIDNVLCAKAEFIQIESLPDSSAGVLKLGNLALAENQLISRNYFGQIVFSPAENTSGCAEFCFRNATFRQSDTSVNCIINILDEVNLAPIASSRTVTTVKNISAFSFLNAVDPENDSMTFEVISYPSHGTVKLSGNTGKQFCYTPQSGYTGKDSFEYMVTDIYGNKSGSAKVEINVSKSDGSIYFDDLSQHWAHNSAIRTASKGLMDGVYDAETGTFNFQPDTTVTRGDFLAMALICAGKEDKIAFTGVTSFADDENIPMNIKSYAEYAAVNGIVSGYTLEDGRRVFASTDPITRAEAAVIVNNILSLPDSDADISVFADSASVPLWADNAISNLTACGIFNGTGYGEIMPDSPVTRAETAEILCNVENYTIETLSSSSQAEKKRSIFNLFGLLG